VEVLATVKDATCSNQQLQVCYTEDISYMQKIHRQINVAHTFYLSCQNIIVFKNTCYCTFV